MRITSATSHVGDGLASRLLPVVGGAVTVRTATSGIAGRLIARKLGLRLGIATLGTLTIRQTPTGERWTRRFGSTRWSSTLRDSGPGTIVERVSGGIELRFGVVLDASWNTVMTLQSLGLGQASIPMPRWVGVTGCIAPDATTDVTIRIPGGTCIYHVEFGGAQ